MAATLGQLQVATKYISCIPGNALAQQALASLGALGVDTDDTLLQGDRLGVYYLLSANGLSKGDVVYDRKYSAFDQLKPGQLDWEQLLSGSTWFHWTAITPALNQDLALVCLEALKAAKKLGLTISVDLNYRNRLWNYGRAPQEVMPELVAYCDVIMGNIWASNTMLNTSLQEGLDRDTLQETYLKHAETTANELFVAHPNCKHIAFTYRFMDSPQHNLFYGTYHTVEHSFHSQTLETHALIDRIGSGDAFMAGLIYALLKEMPPQAVIDTATSSGFNKLFVKGDFGNGKLGT